MVGGLRRGSENAASQSGGEGGLSGLVDGGTAGGCCGTEGECWSWQLMSTPSGRRASLCRWRAVDQPPWLGMPAPTGWS